MLRHLLSRTVQFIPPMRHLNDCITLGANETETDCTVDARSNAWVEAFDVAPMGDMASEFASCGPSPTKVRGLLMGQAQATARSLRDGIVALDQA